MLIFPEILTDEMYADFWEWDGWKPKAKPNAPQELKQAIKQFILAAVSDDEDGSILFK